MVGKEADVSESSLRAGPTLSCGWGRSWVGGHLGASSVGISDARKLGGSFEREMAVGASFFVTKFMDPEAALGFSRSHPIESEVRSGPLASSVVS